MLTKWFHRSEEPRDFISKNMKKILSKNHVCYVVIACSEPSADGQMEVEMAYEGDACLAAYLIESAQGFIDQEVDELRSLEQ